jgi:molecular chaperone Hsp33
MDNLRQPFAGLDDTILPFQLEGRAVRGRIIRIGMVAQEILTAHDYPEIVSGILGEALLIAALIGSSLKFEGRLMVQATGSGPVSMLLAEYRTSGGMRGYARFNAARIATLERPAIPPQAKALLGDGQLAMTIDRGPDFDSYQSLVPLYGNTLGDATEHYFATSEQVPTRVRLAVAAVRIPGRKPLWRLGGAILQPIAGDVARGDTSEDWAHGQALFDTTQLHELIDPNLASADLLFRLFHEEGVRLFDPMSIHRFCSCERGRLARIVASFAPDERSEMKEPDGRIRVICEYCSRHYLFDDMELDGFASVDDGEFNR